MTQPPQFPEPAEPAQPTRGLPGWVWAIVPLLAIVAFAPVLRMWFVGDDFQQLGWPVKAPFPIVLSNTEGMFYRPLSTAIIWELGTALFGTNALPYHIVSLLLHALAAWLLGRAVAAVAGESLPGWIAGALFAVYPLSTEPVAWLSSQWDLWAAVFLLAAVWAFSATWQQHSYRLYALALAASFIAVFMKESVLPSPLIMPFVALATELSGSLQSSARRWRRLLSRAVTWSLPFAVPPALFVAVRISSGAGVGGYPNKPTDFQHFFWDNTLIALRQITMPLNRSVFDPFFAQVGGVLVTGVLLLGLVLWGRQRRPLLVLGAAWITIFLVPVLNLMADDPTRFGNRFLYLSLMGFCVVMGALLASLLDAPYTLGRLSLRGHRIRLGWVLVGAALLVAVPVTWRQLRPWVQSSQQTRHILNELGTLLPNTPGARLTLYVTDLPKLHDGSYVFWNGLEEAMQQFDNQPVHVRQEEHLDSANLNTPITSGAGVFNLDFSFSPDDQIYYVGGLRGVTVGVTPPKSGHVWNNANCANPLQAGLQVVGADFQCAASPTDPPAPGGGYATFTPQATDASLLMPKMNLDVAGARWVRFAFAARLPGNIPGQSATLFWNGAGATDWSSDRSQQFGLDSTGAWRTYWLYISTADLNGQLSGLKLQPTAGRQPIDVAWIAVDVIR